MASSLRGDSESEGKTLREKQTVVSYPVEMECESDWLASASSSVTRGPW